MYQYVPIHTEQWNDINSIYWYVLVHTATCFIFCAFKKKCKKVLNPRSSAYFLKNLPLHHGSTDLNAGYFLCFYQCIYYLQWPPVSAREITSSTMSKVQDVTPSSWARSIRQFHDQHSWVAWIHAAGETYLGALCARIVTCSGQYFLIVCMVSKSRLPGSVVMLTTKPCLKNSE